MKNHFQRFFELNPKLNVDTSIQEIEEKSSLLRNQVISAGDSIEDWLRNPNKTLHLPGFLPKSAEIISDWKEEFSREKYDSISSYHDIHNEVHLYNFLTKIYDLIQESGGDPTDRSSNIYSNCELLIAFGTGSGEALGKLIDDLAPRRLFIFIAEWHEMSSSFDSIDWELIFNQYNQSDTKTIHIARISSGLEALFAVLEGNSALLLDHAYIYQSPVLTDSLKKSLLEFSGEAIPNLIHYTGYTVDEYNMILNSLSTLSASPRQFKKPFENLNQRAIVCGSGPSLDNDIETIRSLSETHVVICGGSNIKTLLKNGIRVDMLVLVERDLSVYDVYYELSLDHDLSNTILAMSCTCYEKLLSLFARSCVFFRPALTPVSIFSEGPQESLEFDGPEAVNAAFAIACKLGMTSIAMFGADLGSKSLESKRSKDAVDYSDRLWDREEKGNFRDYIHTNKAMVDVSLSLQAAINTYKGKIEFYNCSDGMYVEGAIPTHPSDYLAKTSSSSPVCLSSLYSWCDGLYRQTPALVSAKWHSKQIRKHTYDLVDQLLDIYKSDKPWFNDVLNETTHLLDLRGSLPTQIPKRIIRSTVLKMNLVVTQHFHILRKSGPSVINYFGSRSKELICREILHLREEIFELCDIVESRFKLEDSSDVV